MAGTLLSVEWWGVMTFTIEFGWWLLPTVMTLLSFGYVSVITRDIGSDQYGAGAGAAIALGFYLMAAVASLSAWLTWALLA